MQRTDITSGLAGSSLETIAKASKRVRNHIIGNPYQKETLASALQQHALTILKNDELRASELGLVILADVVTIVASITDTSLKLQPAIFQAITDVVQWAQSTMDCGTDVAALRPHLLRATCSLAPGFTVEQAQTLIGLLSKEITVPSDNVNFLGHVCAAIASLGRTLKDPIDVPADSIPCIFSVLKHASYKTQANITSFLAVASRNLKVLKAMGENSKLPTDEHFLDWVVSLSNFTGFQQRPFILIDIAEILVSCSHQSIQHKDAGITTLKRLLNKKSLNKSHYARIVPLLLRYLSLAGKEDFPGRSVAIFDLIIQITKVLTTATKSLSNSTKQDIFALITRVIPGIAKSKKKCRIPKVLISASCEALLDITNPQSLRLAAGQSALILSRANERMHFANYTLTTVVTNEQVSEELCLIILKTLANVIIDSDKLTEDILKDKTTLTAIVNKATKDPNAQIRLAALHVIKNLAHVGSTTSDNKEIVACFSIPDIVKILASTDEEIVFVALGILRNLHHRVMLDTDDLVAWGKEELIQCVVNAVLPIIANGKPRLRRQGFFVVANIATYAPGLSDKTLFSKVLQLTLTELEKKTDDKVKVAAAWFVINSTCENETGQDRRPRIQQFVNGGTQRIVQQLLATTISIDLRDRCYTILACLAVKTPVEQPNPQSPGPSNA